MVAAAAPQAGIVAPLAGPRSWQGVILAYSVWLFVMAALSQEPPASAERRWFLRRGVQAAGGLVLLSTAATWTLLARTLAGARPGRPLFAFQPPAPRLPEFAGVEGLSPEVTPITSFYLMSKTVEDPAVDAGGWRLRIRGLVQRELELTYDDLSRLPRADQWLTLRCVSNPVGGPLIGNALWSGVPLPALLSLAGVQPAASTLVLTGRDGYADSIPVDLAQRDGTLLAYAVNGGLLNRDHGFPARVLVPGLYGFKNVKWVEELRLIAGEFEGPWQRLGWTRAAIQTTFSRIDFVRRAAGGALAGGVAFAGDRGIRCVEVRAGDQPWREATLHIPPLGSLSWVQWLFPFQASGRTTVTVRATDGTGALQQETERGIFPDGATGWHTVTVELA
jgi:DMSO/TMAO reductase YedYZ molybdopterin-dependent catalytic subunit